MVVGLCLLPLLLVISGCPLTPEKARDGIATAYGFVSDLQQKYLVTCQANPAQNACVQINRGVALQRLASTALNDYCSGTPLAGNAPYLQGGPCSAQPGLQPRLQAALTDLNSIIADLKKLPPQKAGQ
jgi:hypothetical protein